MDADLRRLEDWFEAYAADYFQDEASRGVLMLKRDHSLRVLEECRTLTREERFDPALARACHAGALLHDVGRFPQYRKHQTLRDALSVNHAVLSAATIKRERVLTAYAPEVERLILYAVVLHNRKRLPACSDAALRLASMVLRDADKLDIVRVMLGDFALNQADRDAAFFVLDPDPDGYSQAILDSIAGRRMADHADMRYHNDFYLLVLSWAYDLNFPASRRLFAARGYVDRIVANLPGIASIEKVGRQVIQDLTD
jgi:hypothetical protein